MTDAKNEKEEFLQDLSDCFITNIFLIGKLNGGFLTTEVEELFQGLNKYGYLSDDGWEEIQKHIEFVPREDMEKKQEEAQEEMVEQLFGQIGIDTGGTVH